MLGTDNEQQEVDNMKFKHFFQRKENKYLFSKDQFDCFLSDLLQYMQVDQYGLHTIRSLYYDTSDNQFILSSMEKPEYKEKFRVRSYGNPMGESFIFLEIKKKSEGIVYKRRLSMTYSEYLEWESSKIFPEAFMEKQVAKEIAWLFRKYPDLSPKVLISYDRLSLFYEADDNFRVTFDRNIRYQSKEVGLCSAPGPLVAPDLDVLMEVKAVGAYPIWFVELLSRHQRYKGNFSKYAQTYQCHLM